MPTKVGVVSLMSVMRWAGAPARHDEPIEARRSRNVVSGVFLGCGVLVTALALFVLPGWHPNHLPALIVIACILFAGALSQIVSASSVPVAANHATTAVAAVALAVVQILVGAPVAAGTVGLMYLWVAVLAAMYYSPRAATLHVAELVIAQIVAAAWLGNIVLLPVVVMSAATCITVAALVGLLTRHLRQQMDADPLTKLLNRRGLDQAFTVSIAGARRERQPLCVAVLDLDAFKSLNDTQGHAAGDAILIETARGWQHVLRPGDTLARVGGDEFVALLPGCDAAMAANVLRRLLDATPAAVSCSAGAAIYRRGDTAESLLLRADSALYRAKAMNGLALVIDDEVAA